MAQNKIVKKDNANINRNAKNKEALVPSNTSASSKTNVCVITAFVIAILVPILSFQIYVTLMQVPDLPKYDLNMWWGPNERKNNQDTSIRPYRVIFTEAMFERLYKKFDYYRQRSKTKSFPDSAWTYGINSEAIAQVFAHWQFNYTRNYKQRETLLNKFSQFKTNIQGLDIHFLHVKPNNAENVKVFPLLLLHGWPGSVREFYELIPLLTAVRPGYDFVFEIIAPSLPGFIYSQAPVRPGLSPFQIAIVMRNLMERLGFSKYYVQGGDFGHTIGSHMATLFPNEVLGFHTNFPVHFSKLAELTWLLGAIWPTLVDKQYSDRIYPLTNKILFYLEESGYIHLQATKPDTVGIVLHDSPAGLAAYILDKYMVFSDPNNKLLEDGGLSMYDRDGLLDNIMLYWASESIITASRLYKESFDDIDTEKTLAKIPTTVPTWGFKLKHELIYQPDFVLRWKYTNLLGTTVLDDGGHFAAFEKPKELADDVFLAVKNFVVFPKQS